MRTGKGKMKNAIKTVSDKVKLLRGEFNFKRLSTIALLCFSSLPVRSVSLPIPFQPANRLPCTEWEKKKVSERSNSPILFSSPTPFRSNSSYANKAKKTSKTTSRHQSTVGQSFLFILLKEKLYLTLFSVRRSQPFISHRKSLIFNGRL